jgi:hypothetical protein
VKTTAAERVEEARELVPFALDDAAEGRKQRNPVAEAFPNLARAQYVDTYVDLDFVRVLAASIDKRAFLRQTLIVSERAAQAFPNSAVFTLFHVFSAFITVFYYFLADLLRVTSMPICIQF